MLTLTPEPLTREAFKPFGDVIEASDASHHFSINAGNTERFHDLAKLDPGADGRVIVSIFRGQARALPFIVEMMERHPLASQAFIPLSGRSYLVAVASAGKKPEAQDIRVFMAAPHQGVNYATGVWHHPLLTLHGMSDFLVIDRAGPGQNYDEVKLDELAQIKLA